MGKLTYFPVLIDRWVAGTRGLTYEQKGFYFDVLLWMFETGKPVKDADHAARILCCDPRISRRLLADLSDKFRQTSDGLRHKLVDELIRNGGKIRGLHAINFPTDPDPDPDPEEEKEKITPPIVPPLPEKPATKPAPKRARFQRPDVSAVTAYCQERNNHVDAVAFIDHYESKGWVVGKSPMKDWKAAVRTWERRNIKVNGNDNYDRPIRGSADWYAERAKRRMDELEAREVLGADEGSVRGETLDGEAWRDDE